MKREVLRDVLCAGETSGKGGCGDGGARRGASRHASETSGKGDCGDGGARSEARQHASEACGTHTILELNDDLLADKRFEERVEELRTRRDAAPSKHTRARGRVSALISCKAFPHHGRRCASLHVQMYE